MFACSLLPSAAGMGCNVRVHLCQAEQQLR